MNRGLILKTIREVWLITLLFSVAMAAVEGLLAYIMPSFFEASYAQWLKLKFVQTLLKGLLGTEIAGAVGPEMITSIAWVHPVVLAIAAAHEIVLCTRVPAGEVDRGTIDVLLALPVSRTHVYVCESIVWLGAGLVVIALGLAGNLIGGWLAPSTLGGTLNQLIIIVANMYCLYLAVGGMAWLVSALGDRRGRAVGIVFGIVLASFLLNFLAQFGGLAEKMVFLSVLDYYRPLFILRDSSWPVTDMLVLTAVGAVLWLAGAIIFARRDIRTV